MYFAYRECPKLFTYRETKAVSKTVTEKRHGHKVLNFSVCAKKFGLRPEKEESEEADEFHDSQKFLGQSSSKTFLKNSWILYVFQF